MMKEKHIRIDMEIKSSPVWFSSDGQYFINGSIEELDISSKLKESLKKYKDIWHDYKKGEKIKDIHLGNFNNIDEYVLSISRALKKEIPEFYIYVWSYKEKKNFKI